MYLQSQQTTPDGALKIGRKPWLLSEIFQQNFSNKVFKKKSKY